MAPTASAAIHDPCQSERIRSDWLVASRTGIAKVGMSCDEQAVSVARRSRPSGDLSPNAAVGRSRTDPTLPLRSGRAADAIPGGRLRGQHPTPDDLGPGGGWPFGGRPRMSRLAAAAAAQRLGEQIEVRRPAHLDGAERHQVVGGPLHVEQPRAGPRPRPGAARPARPGPPWRRRARGGTSTPPRTGRPPPRRTARRPAGPARPVRRSRPRRCAPSPGRAAGGRPPRRPCGSSRPAGAGRRSRATTSSYAVSTRISNRRQAARSDRLTRSPSSGSTPRGSGDHHPIGPRRWPTTGIGNSPAR